MTYKVFFSNSGVYAASLTPTWVGLIYVSDGSAYASPPTIEEVGLGWYKITENFDADVVGIIDGGASLTINRDRYVPFFADVVENLTFKNILKRLKVVFDGEIERTDGATDRTLVFKDSGAATETTHTISSTGRTVS